MAADAWLPLLTQLVNTELAERDHAERQGELIGQLIQAGTPILKMVEALGAFLTTSDDAQRARATSVLAEVAEAVPTAATGEGEVHHLAEFFTSRLTDWPAVRGALKGCLALLLRRVVAAFGAIPGPAATQQQPRWLAEVEDGAAVEMLRTCVSHVFIRALAQQDRTLALRLLVAAVQGYGDALLRANLDLMEYVISSVDGEKDPRCLLLCFEAVQCLLRLYHRQPEASLCHERLEEGAEELFEVLACYFPVTFSPTPNDPNRITRQELAAGLEATLAAEPLFAPHVMLLACEKLSSALRQAKLDSLSLLGACAEGYGPAVLASHVGTLWAALRPELAAPAAEGMLPADQLAADQLATAAATCLARCIAAFQGAAAAGSSGSNSGGGGEVPTSARLADAVLEDSSIQDLLACIQAPGQDAAMHRRSVLRAQVGARAAEALCRAGGGAAAKALGQLLPPLLALVAVQQSEGGTSSSGGGWQSQCLAWSAVLGLLEASAAAPAHAEGGAASACLFRQAVATAAAALAVAATAQPSAMEVDEEEEDDDDEENPTAKQHVQPGCWPLQPGDCTQQCAVALQLLALAAVFAGGRQAAALSRQDVEAAVQSVLLLLMGPSCRLSGQRQAAVAPLAALAGSIHNSVLVDVALPQLVVAMGQQHTAAAALAALQALAAASRSLQLDIVVALDQTIQQLLPTVTAQAAEAASGSNQLLRQLLQTAQRIVAAPPCQDAAEGAAAATCFLQLGQHLFDAIQLLSPQAAAVAGGPELQTACAELAYHAVAFGSAEQQQQLAALAANTLLQQQYAGTVAAGGLHATICCALLVPLRQEAVRGLTSEQPATALVQQLVKLALAQPQEAPARHWAAVAAAALLNKWAVADKAGLAATSSAVLHQQLFPACGLAAADSRDEVSGGGLPAPAPAAWSCLATVSRGLAMRGSQDADVTISRVIGSLDVAAQCWQQAEAASGAAQAPDMEDLAIGAQAAACFLGAVLDGSGSFASSEDLTKQAHAVAKPLWQQRLYIDAASQLLPLLQRSVQSASDARQDTPAAGKEASPLLASPVLLLGMAHLLRAAPKGVQQQEQHRMLPWVIQCVAGLQRGQLADGDLLLSLLLLLSDALLSGAGKQQAEAQLLPRLVPVLLELAVYRPLAAVRETALQCLLLLVELPYTCLHPYRRTVARVLEVAVDDSRRSVRLQAARCRQAWSAF